MLLASLYLKKNNRVENGFKDENVMKFVLGRLLYSLVDVTEQLIRVID